VAKKSKRKEPPGIIVHCSKCGKAIHGENFAIRMTKLRSHYQSKHPKLFKKWGKRAAKTRKKKARGKK